MGGTPAADGWDGPGPQTRAARAGPGRAGSCESPTSVPRPRIPQVSRRSAKSAPAAARPPGKRKTGSTTAGALRLAAAAPGVKPSIHPAGRPPAGSVAGHGATRSPIIAGSGSLRAFKSGPVQRAVGKRRRPGPGRAAPGDPLGLGRDRPRVPQVSSSARKLDAGSSVALVSNTS